MPCAFGGAETGGWFAKEIKSAARPQGPAHAHLRARRQGDVAARRHHRARAGRRIAAAFAAKKIDAAELYHAAVDERQGLKDKVKLIYMPGWHQPETVLELLVNKDRWDALSDQQRGLIDGACLATLAMRRSPTAPGCKPTPSPI